VVGRGDARGGEFCLLTLWVPGGKKKAGAGYLGDLNLVAVRTGVPGSGKCLEAMRRANTGSVGIGLVVLFSSLVNGAGEDGNVKLPGFLSDDIVAMKSHVHHHLALHHT